VIVGGKGSLVRRPCGEADTLRLSFEA